MSADGLATGPEYLDEDEAALDAYGCSWCGHRNCKCPEDDDFDEVVAP